MATEAGDGPIRAMQATAWPLSGDVTQSILPSSWWSHGFGQWGVVNINLGRTPDPARERRILETAGSYGHQLGRLSEALQAVIDALLKDADGNLDRAKLTDEQIAALVRFEDLMAAVEKAKAG
jgi:hypothetical protein